MSATDHLGLTPSEFETLVRAAAWLGLDKHSVWPHLPQLLAPTLPRELRDKVLRMAPEQQRQLCTALAARQQRDRETPTKEHVVPERLRPHARRELPSASGQR